jgi:carbon starvation protein
MTVSLPLLAAVVLVALVLGYTLYGRLVARQFRLDDTVRTPAHEYEDGVDFVPARPFYLLGQHFSAISAAGPIAGPILACLWFGWLPAVLWIVLGVVFIGAVHDFTALVASVRHRARSVAEIVKEHVGSRAWGAVLCFIWIALVYVIVAFADITAATFVGTTEELTEGTRGTFEFNRGGAVAAASTMYLALAVVMGFVVRRLSPPLWLTTAVFVPATAGVIWLGTRVSTAFVLPHTTWVVLIMAYCFVAALVPVWTLLQPRGYLGGFVLYAAIAVGVVGMFFGGFEVLQPATNAAAPLAGLEGSPLFPILFVTIACGACSGFHGLVCSGTTSKQVARESHCRVVGYGGMLLEAFIALIALATVLIVAPAAAAGKAPGVIYGEGMARFLTSIVGEQYFLVALTFGSMAFSTFVFDTIDVATRLGRYILQELTGLMGRAPAVAATAVTAGVPLVVALSAGEGGWKTFWVLFGTSNQLLAAITLMGVTVWLRRTGRRTWFTVGPMLFVMTVTVWALVLQVRGFVRTLAVADGLPVGPLANAVVGVVLLALTGFLVVECARALLRGGPAPPSGPGGAGQGGAPGPDVPGSPGVPLAAVAAVPAGGTGDSARE